MSLGFPGGSMVKNPSANVGDARDMGSIPGLGISPGIGNGNPLQYSCLENFIDRQLAFSSVLCFCIINTFNVVMT